jgi:hypothetical protein
MELLLARHVPLAMERMIMPGSGTQCDHCLHGPLDKCKQDCRVKEQIEHFKQFVAGLPEYNAGWCREHKEVKP